MKKIDIYANLLKKNTPSPCKDGACTVSTNPHKEKGQPPFLRSWPLSSLAALSRRTYVFNLSC